MGLIYQFFCSLDHKFAKRRNKTAHGVKHKIIRNSTLWSTTTHFFGKSDKMYKRKKLK